MILIKQEYKFLEKIDNYFGYCENNGCILLYSMVESGFEIYSPPQSFIEKVENNRKKIKNYKPIDHLIINKAWKIDRTGNIL